MGINEGAYMRLKRQADDAVAAHQRAVGAYDAAMARLKTVFGCSSIRDAERKLAGLEQDAAEAEAAYNKAASEFAGKFNEKL